MILQAEKINKRFMRKNGGSNFFYAVQDMRCHLIPDSSSLYSDVQAAVKVRFLIYCQVF